MTDYFRFRNQEESGQALIDTTPLLEKINNNLSDIRDFLAPKVKSKVLNAIQLPINQTATRLLPQNLNRSTVIIRNVGSASIYIGDQNVAASNGFQLLLDDALVIDEFTGELWAIADGVGGSATLIEG